MSLARDRLVLAATAVSESAWLFAVFGVLGLVLRGEESPLAWPAGLAVLVTGIVVSRMLQSIIMSDRAWYAVQLSLASLVVYLTVASQVATDSRGFDLLWVARLDTTSESDVLWFRGVFAAVLALGLWWRAVRLAASESPYETLMASFRVGVVGIALATVVDTQHTADLDIYPMMFVFIGSALVGLGMSRLMPFSGRAANGDAWPRVIGGVVIAIVAVGLFLGLVLDRLVPFVSRGLSHSLDFLGENVVQPVALTISRPIVFFLNWIISLFTPPPSQAPGEGFSRLPEERELISEGLVEREVPALVGIIGWTLLAIVLIVAVYLVLKALRRRIRGGLVYPAGQRESVAGDADPLHDVANLLLRLVPDRFRRREQWTPYRLPEGEPRIVEALRIYYRLLTLAEMGGVARSPAETPSEFQRKLESKFPPRLVRMATAAFDRAFYGDHPSSETQLVEMRASLEALPAPGA